MDAPFGSWGKQTLIAGLTADALIAPWVIKGAMDGTAFAAYVSKVLVPEIEPSTVVILDNLATDRNVEATPRTPGPRLLVPLPAALLARPHSHRTGLLKAQGSSPKDRRTDLHRAVRRHRRDM